MSRHTFPPAAALLFTLAITAAACSKKEEPPAAPPAVEPAPAPEPLPPRAVAKLEADKRAAAEREAFNKDLEVFGKDGLEAGLAKLEEAKTRHKLHLQRLALAAKEIEIYAPNVRFEIERHEIGARVCDDEIKRLRKLGKRASLPDVERSVGACRAFGGHLGRFEEELIVFGDQNDVDLRPILKVDAPR